MAAIRRRSHSMRIGRPVLIGLLGGSLAVAVWSAVMPLFMLPIGMAPIDGNLRWALIGCGFAYGLLGGLYLARNLAYLSGWMLVTGLYSALVCELIHQLARFDTTGFESAAFAFATGFLYCTSVSLLPQSPVNEDAIRFVVLGALIRMVPCFVVSVALLAIAGALRDLTAIFVGALGLFGMAMIWALIGQELRIRKLHIAVRNLQRDAASTVKPAANE